MAAAILVAAGLYLTWLDGRGTCDVPGVTCPRTYATASIGATLWIAGMALLVLGIVVRVARRPRSRSTRHDRPRAAQT